MTMVAAMSSFPLAVEENPIAFTFIVSRSFCKSLGACCSFPFCQGPPQRPAAERKSAVAKLLSDRAASSLTPPAGDLLLGAAGRGRGNLRNADGEVE
jgi:hypothetical protein